LDTNVSGYLYEDLVIELVISFGSVSQLMT